MQKKLGDSPENPSMSPAEVLDDMAGMVCGTVEMHRGRGIKQAIWLAARELGLPARRVRAYWHREVAPTAVRGWERERVKARFRRVLEASCERMEAECQEIRKQLRETETENASVVGLVREVARETTPSERAGLAHTMDQMEVATRSIVVADSRPFIATNTYVGWCRRETPRAA